MIKKNILLFIIINQYIFIYIFSNDISTGITIFILYIKK